MAAAIKLTNLSDNDPAPEVYETPDLTDGSTTATATDARPGSGQSSDDDAAYNDNLIQQRLDPDLARHVFEPSRVNAKDADFSERIDRYRESYRVKTSRRRRTRDEGEDSSESEDDEGPSTPEAIQRRATKLQRQALKLQTDFARLRGQQAANGRTEKASGEEQLDKLLASLQLSETGTGASASLTDKLASNQQLRPQAETVPVSRQPSNAQPAREIVKLDALASLDARLASIETSLGLGSIETSKDSAALDTPLLSQLEILHKQITFLSNTSPTSLDSLSTKIKGLTSDADALEAARKRAKSAQLSAARSSVGPDTFARRKSGFVRDGTAERTPDTATAVDNEDISQLGVVYKTLPMIERLAPMLSPMLERLRSLNLIHAEAGNAASRLSTLQTRQVEMDDELKACTEAVEKIEEVVIAREEGLKENLKVVEDWVKELEGRVSALS